MEPKTGKRIVSKDEYVQVVMKRAGIWLLCFALLCCLALLPPVLGMGVKAACCVVVFMAVPGWVIWILIAYRRWLMQWAQWGAHTGWNYGLYGVRLLLHEHKLRQIQNANPADLPAPDTLVRASVEPIQEQEAVLLRAATEGVERHEEQLLRVSVGME